MPYIRDSADLDDDARSWIDPEEFGVNHRPLLLAFTDRKSFGTDDEDRERDNRLERALDGNGSDSDSSSLDIHTPLP